MSTESGRYYFNTPGGDNTYVGYMYGTAGSTTYVATHANTNDSIIKQLLDTWYENHISGTTNEQYIADAIYCNDREVTKSISGYTGDGYGISVTAYKPYERIFVNNSPSLKCKQVNDRFTKSTSINRVSTNGKMQYAIGLIIADEVVYAGTSSSKSNTKNYLYSSDGYFTMTSYNFYSSFSYEQIIGVSGGGFWEDVSTENVLRKSNGYRPVISLKVNTLSSGTGIKSDPFKAS